MDMIFEFYEQKYLEKVYFKIEFAAVHQTGRILHHYLSSYFINSSQKLMINQIFKQLFCTLDYSQFLE